MNISTDFIQCVKHVCVCVCSRSHVSMLQTSKFEANDWLFNHINNEPTITKTKSKRRKKLIGRQMYLASSDPCWIEFWCVCVSIDGNIESRDSLCVSGSAKRNWLNVFVVWTQSLTLIIIASIQSRIGFFFFVNENLVLRQSIYSDWTRKKEHTPSKRCRQRRKR